MEKRIIGDGICLTCNKPSPFWCCDDCQKKKGREKIKNYLRLFFESILIFAIITLIWQGYEKVVIGEVQPDFFDTVVATILTFTIVVIRKQAEKIKRQQIEIDGFHEKAREFRDIVQVYQAQCPFKE
ncbi:hypothetical protein MXL46_11310 [Heyndrickxia sporothermodurans]|uniref:Holin n=1 Tax=Siminovitchia thermophila TaxID=1245522 RepID=A0ABS2R7H7_9BACI|nr:MULTISPECIES: hypothetical protein [Bacillaceae]MBM7715365.1 hypothetical protein [Siminovitchia thermophila]MEB6549674.1 hypothetical protein [Heyndrickxia sporothermodurans]